MRKPQSQKKKEEMALLGQRLNSLRTEAGLSLSYVAERLNREYGANTNKGMMSKYENGIHEPSATTIYCLSRIFNVSPEYITGKTDEKFPPVPVQGAETTGYCLKFYSSLTDYDEGVIDESESVIIPNNWLVGGQEFFAFRVKGGRFAPRYYDGDILIFQRKIKSKKNQVALVSIDGGEGFLCFITKKRDGKVITPLDPAYDSTFYTTEEIASRPVKILGLCVQMRRQEFSL